MGCTQTRDEAPREFVTSPTTTSSSSARAVMSPTTLDFNKTRVLPESTLSSKVDLKITVAQRTKTLNLADERLHGVPAPLLKMKGLRELDMQSNALTSFVPLDEPSTLTKLNLSMNRLLTVPRLAFQSLQRLDLSSNRLTFFPDFSGLPALTELYLDHNKLGCAPGSEVFPSNLVVLDISYNLFTAIPSQIGELSQLADLNVASNLLVSFGPARVVKGLKSLAHLDISNNKIADIPDELFTHTPLARLLLKNNRVKEADLLQKESYSTFLSRKAITLDRLTTGLSMSVSVKSVKQLSLK
ncbi:Plant intracellular Ras-group-related LRR protein 2 [Diplonema papillatum]|nr:Plant intracellular Ras-group-related LRR protein 2 [Diplonema papillatum]